jgi:hypothetical protein
MRKEHCHLEIFAELETPHFSGLARKAKGTFRAFVNVCRVICG